MADLLVCVCCGAASHRTDWINKSGKSVACDKHSKSEFASAVAKVGAPVPPVTTQEPPAGNMTGPGTKIPPKAN